MLFYRAALPLSRKTLNYVAGIRRRHLRAIGSRWRKLNPGHEALLALVYLRKGETSAELAAGFGVGRTTAWRYVNETVGLLAARAPKLRQAVRGAKKAGHAYVILDGTLIAINRVAADRPFYSGKHKKHGMNLQVIASPHGDILRVSGALPGSVHDKKAEWVWGVLDGLEKGGLVTLADKGYQGSTWAKIPYRGKNKPEPRKEANRAHAKLRASGERAAQNMEDSPQAPLLPLARRGTRKGHPCIATPRGVTRMESALCPFLMVGSAGWTRAHRMSGSGPASPARWVVVSTTMLRSVIRFSGNQARSSALLAGVRCDRRLMPPVRCSRRLHRRHGMTRPVRGSGSVRVQSSRVTVSGCSVAA